MFGSFSTASIPSPYPNSTPWTEAEAQSHGSHPDKRRTGYPEVRRRAGSIGDIEAQPDAQSDITTSMAPEGARKLTPVPLVERKHERPSLRRTGWVLIPYSITTPAYGAWRHERSSRPWPPCCDGGVPCPLVDAALSRPQLRRVTSPILQTFSSLDARGTYDRARLGSRPGIPSLRFMISILLPSPMTRETPKCSPVRCTFMVWVRSCPVGQYRIPSHADFPRGKKVDVNEWGVELTRCVRPDDPEFFSP